MFNYSNHLLLTIFIKSHEVHIVIVLLLFDRDRCSPRPSSGLKKVIFICRWHSCSRPLLLFIHLSDLVISFVLRHFPFLHAAGPFTCKEHSIRSLNYVGWLNISRPFDYLWSILLEWYGLLSDCHSIGSINYLWLRIKVKHFVFNCCFCFFYYNWTAGLNVVLAL